MKKIFLTLILGFFSFSILAEGGQIDCTKEENKGLEACKCETQHTAGLPQGEGTGSGFESGQQESQGSSKK